MVCSSSMKRMMRPLPAQLLEHRLQALLELAAILGTGQQPGHVEDQHLLALQRFRHFAIDDALRQAFDDGRLADARLADQHRVVLGAALQDLDGAADFIVAADHRIELALSGALGQVDAVFLQRLALAFGFLRIDALPATHGHDRRSSALRLRPCCLAIRPVSPLSSHNASRNISLAMNWSPRFCASLSVRLSRLDRSRPTDTSPPWPETCGRR
jgi:hypothetical protein